MIENINLKKTVLHVHASTAWSHIRVLEICFLLFSPFDFSITPTIVNLYKSGADPGRGANPARAPQKLEKIRFFCVKS